MHAITREVEGLSAGKLVADRDSTGTHNASLPNCDLRPAEKTERRWKRYGER